MACKWQSSTPYDCKPGLCVIINNMKFDANNLEDLNGGKDQCHLEEVFDKLGFAVDVHQNLTANRMMLEVANYGTMKHNGVFVLIILSHGGAGDVVYGTDYSLEVHTLQQMFYTTRCPSLAGVPKVFLIDACRGDTEEKGHSYRIPKTDREMKSSETRTYITDSSDFITVFASTHGNAAYVDEDGRSYFIQTLVEVIEEAIEADENTEFNEIIREVRFRIQQDTDEEEIQIQTQTVQTNSTLMRPYYIIRHTGMVDNSESEEDNNTEAMGYYEQESEEDDNPEAKGQESEEDDNPEAKGQESEEDDNPEAKGQESEEDDNPEAKGQESEENDNP